MLVAFQMNWKDALGFYHRPDQLFARNAISEYQLILNLWGNAKSELGAGFEKKPAPLLSFIC